MPIVTLGGIGLNLSYGVFIAAAVIFSLTLMSRSAPGNSDLPRAAAIGVGFWVLGWLVQAVAFLLTAVGLGLSTRSLTIGLIGVESAPRRWTARRSLIVSIVTVGSLLFLGVFWRLIEGGFRMPQWDSLAATPSWLSRFDAQGFRPPPMEFNSRESVFRFGSWLCGLQAVCQLFPLPRTMGRVMYGALVAICSPRFDALVQARLFRRCLIALAMMTLGIAMWVMSGEGQSRFPRWPLFFLLAVLLWISSHRSDVRELLAGFAAAEAGGPSVQPSLWDQIRTARTRQKQTRSLKRALQSEREEAVDAARLDDILERLHVGGRESLSEADRQILKRVSGQLRKARDQVAPESGDKDA